MFVVDFACLIDHVGLRRSLLHNLLRGSRVDQLAFHRRCDGVNCQIEPSKLSILEDALGFHELELPLDLNGRNEGGARSINSSLYGLAILLVFDVEYVAESNASLEEFQDGVLPIYNAQYAHGVPII